MVFSGVSTNNVERLKDGLVIFILRMTEEKYILNFRTPKGMDGRNFYKEIEFNKDDLKNHNSLLQERISNLAVLLETAGWQNKDDEEKCKELKEYLYGIASAGHALFIKIFGDSVLLDEFANENEKPALIEIATNDFFVPWELLYPCNPDETLKWEKFLGFQFLISRQISEPTTGASYQKIPPEIVVERRPSLALLKDDSLPNVKNEVMYFKSFEEQGMLDLNIFMEELDPRWERSGVEKLKEFFKHHFHIIHFACHAYADEKNNLKSAITLTRNFELRLEHLEHKRITSVSRPIIFLNACETGNLNSLNTQFFAKQFYLSGARGVIATECIIPDAFAAKFSQIMYQHLLKGEEIGNALYKTRWSFWISEEKPTGLIYSLYALPHIRIKQGGKNG